MKGASHMQNNMLAYLMQYVAYKGGAKPMPKSWRPFIYIIIFYNIQILL